MDDNGDSLVENPNIAPEQKQGDEQATREQSQGEERIVGEVPASRRTPFTNLSQVDADLALARRLQEQERAYMMLTMNSRVFGGGRSYLRDVEDEDDEEDEDEDDDFDDAETVNDEDDDVEDNNSRPVSNSRNETADNVERDFDDNAEDVANADNGIYIEEDAFDVHLHLDEDNEDVDYEDEDDEEDDRLGVEFDPDLFPNDEAYALALQDHEERELVARIADLISEVADHENNGGISQDMWEEEDDSDELSYEELLALGEVVGTESRGLSADSIASLPTVDFKSHCSQAGSNDSCVICRLDYEDGETVTLLSCKHSYHFDCINNWLKIKKICPVCSTEVSTSQGT